MLKGKKIKVNTKQYYSEKTGKMGTKYILTTSVLRRNRKGEKVVKDEELFNSYSKVEVLKYLAGLYKELGDASG